MDYQNFFSQLQTLRAERAELDEAAWGALLAKDYARAKALAAEREALESKLAKLTP